MAISNQEIMLVDIDVTGVAPSMQEKSITEELTRINSELERASSNASNQDLVLAVACGLLSAATDALVVGDASILGNKDMPSIKNPLPNTPIKVNQKEVTQKATLSDLLTRAIPQSEYIQTTEVTKYALKFFEQHAGEYSTLGLLSTILVQLLHATSSSSKGSSITDLPINRLPRILIPFVISGFLAWIVKISSDDSLHEEERDVPQAIAALVLIVNQIPIMKDIANSAQKWAKELSGKILSSTNGSHAFPSVSAAFLLFFLKLNNIPEVAQTDLYRTIQRMPDIQKCMPGSVELTLDALGKQAIPVLLNEVLTRMCFFVTRFASAWNTYQSTEELDWENVMPFGSRTVERMITVASMTLSMADTADAAIRAGIESAGNSVVYAQRFVARFNYVAAGRVAVAIIREAQAENAEFELLCERRKLTEAQAALVKERMQTYVVKLQERLDEYLATDLTAFLQGMSLMDDGLVQGDSNKVIAGNVIIQRVLGVNPQFTTQDEFDALMNSEDDFVL